MVKVQKPYEQSNRVVGMDSTRYYIELEHLDYLSPLFNEGYYKVNAKSGEVIGDIMKDSFHKIDDVGIKTRYVIGNVATGYGTRKDVLIILFNSKVLKNRYGEGITMSNVRLALDYLNSQKVARISLEKFLSKGRITDTDTKLDFVAESHRKKFIPYLDNHSVVPYSWKLNGAKNKGIQWMTRENTVSYISQPFTKFYNKYDELHYGKSKEFWEFHCPNTVVNENAWRLEVTTKNNKVFKSNGLENNYLLTYLNHLDTYADRIFNRALKKYLSLDRIVHQDLIGEMKGLSPSEKYKMTAINYYVNHLNFSLEVAVEKIAKDHTNTRQQKSREKKILLSLIDRVFDTHYYNKKVRDYMDEIISYN